MTLDTEFYRQVVYALGIGVLVGLERAVDQELREGQAERALDGGAPAPSDPTGDIDYLGVRTFGILSLTGFGAALAGAQIPFLAPVLLLAASLLVLLMYHKTSEKHGTGITTEVAALACLGLGALCSLAPEAAGVLGLLLTVLLAMKRFTRQTVRKMRRVELTDTLKFLVAVLIVLPLLPNRALDPWEALNPYKVGLLVVLISGLSFVGYFLTRILGAQRGLGLTGILGGLTSSTAVTAAMAAQARQNPQLSAVCAFSTVAANATMFLRVLVVVALLDQALALRLAWSLGGMALVAAVAALVLWLRASRESRHLKETGQIKLKNPFSVGPALKFAAFFVGILVVAKLAKQYLGDSGLYLAAAASGLADVDAITLSITEGVGARSLALDVGAIGITIAVVSNSLVKTGIALYSGGLRFGRTIGLCLGLATGAGLALAFLL
ncbi:MAG TPA: DUF4010 domain-containing protein [Myxococcota bacterium]|nr:DUF4010 domain-containing protein [Myxococcota bacterium]HRY94602.1 DUF4010 domain-containing protein [Myxococcota bacterium]HSA20316.1 DUF4010 domain-containing protein [Myxococcota bacterium]